MQSPRQSLGRRAAPTVLAVLAGLTVAVAGASSVSARPASAHGAAGCPTVAIIGVRGSGQHSQMGPEVSYMAGRLTKALERDGQSVQNKWVDYQALSVDVLTKLTKFQRVLIRARQYVAAAADWWHHNFRTYNASINDGIAKTIALVDTVTSACQNTDLVMIGYSQGAMAIHQAELQMDDANDDAVNAVTGSILLGDGDRTAHSQAERVGSSPAGGQGVRTWFHVRHRDVDDPEGTVEICARHDIVCDFGLPGSVTHNAQDSAIHTGYLQHDQRDLNAGVDWLAGQLIGP